MATVTQRTLSVAVPPNQLRHICLTDEGGKHFIWVYNIVFVRGSGNFTTFHILDSEKPEGIRRITASGNLGSYIKELGKGFQQPNQSFLFNRLYLRCITSEKAVQLYYPQQHPLITISKTYRSQLLQQLSATE